jgi:hypothetical protein
MNTISPIKKMVDLKMDGDCTGARNAEGEVAKEGCVRMLIKLRFE